MFEYLRPADSLSLTIAWQSSMFLALGLAAVVACRLDDSVSRASP
ncbi:hypothetical protein [Paludisphaera borealis]|nr:hypothetical protein [Paludisphaera borealis]